MPGAFRLLGMVRWAAIMFACVVALTSLRAQAFSGETILGAGSQRPTPMSVGHTWFVLRTPSGVGAVVFHLPPPGPAGSLSQPRYAQPLLSMPVAIAAGENRLYMMYEESGPGLPLINGRNLLSMSTTPTERGAWETARGGRLDVHPPLRGDGRLRALGVGEAGVFAVLDSTIGAGGPEQVASLYVLAGDLWSSVEMPAELRDMGARASVVSIEDAWSVFPMEGGVGVLYAPLSNGVFPGDEPRRAMFWRAKVAVPASPGWRFVGPVEPPRAEWTREQLPDEVQAAMGRGLCKAGVSAGLLTVFTASAGGGGSELWTLPLDGAGAWRRVAELPAVPLRAAFAPRDDAGRVAMVWSDMGTDKSGKDKRDPPVVMAEVSVRTGSLMEKGEFRVGSPVSASDFRGVALLLLWVVGLAVIMIARVPADGAVVLPDDRSIAEPSRRVIAGLIDAVIVLFFASRMYDIPFFEAIRPSTWMSGEGQTMALTALGMAVAMGTLLEWAWGRTLGKMFAGCEVVTTRAALDTGVQGGGVLGVLVRRPPIWVTFLRNLVKWCVPPVAILGLADSEGLHRADRLLRTAVVVEGIPEEEEDDDLEG